MSPRTSYVVVGSFLVTGLVLFVLVAFWVGETRLGTDTRPVDMVFRQSVAGLSEGGSVRFMGVEVGTVKSLRLLPDASPAVRVRARIRRDTPVGPDTRAALAYEGITGVTYVNLEHRPDSEAVYELSDEDVPEIPTASEGLRSLLDALPGMATRVNDVVDRAERLLSDRNLQRVENSLQAVEAVAAGVAGQRPEIEQAIADAAVATAELRASARGLRELVDEAGPHVADGSESLAAAAARSRELARELSAWLDRNRASLEAFVQQGLGQVEPVLKQAEAALADLERLARELRDDPSDVLYHQEEDAIVLEP